MLNRRARPEKFSFDLYNLGLFGASSSFVSGSGADPHTPEAASSYVIVAFVGRVGMFTFSCGPYSSGGGGGGEEVLRSSLPSAGGAGGIISKPTQTQLPW